LSQESGGEPLPAPPSAMEQAGPVDGPVDGRGDL
jgi:hypothetical protein